MDAAAAAPPQAQTAPSQATARPPRHRKPRRAREPADESHGTGVPGSGEPVRSGVNHRPARNAALTLTPSTIAPQSRPSSTNPSSAENSAAETRSRQGPGRRGRGARPQQARTVNGRQFGGQLTRDDEATQSPLNAANQLQADAPVFVPGQQRAQHEHRKQPPQPRQPRQQKRRASKSAAPDIATRTHEDIDNGYYECPICTSEVQRNSKVWSCHMCWTVFHLTCIKKWSTNEGSAAAQPNGRTGEMPPARQWRCPGCNLPQDTLPKMYTCWCEKEVEPRPLAGLPPHSCGQTCGKERVRKCPHSCGQTCHAGPCPPCTHMGPTQICFCGKRETTKRCQDTEYDVGWSCGEICGDIMPCGEHTCPRPCHSGLCGACEVRLDARCFCGQVEKQILCDDRGEEQESHRIHIAEDGQDVTEEWTGLFECGNACDRAFDCGIHHCEKQCHPQQAQPEHCPRSPDIVSHCPCGKTDLVEISDKPRYSCQDPIPNCDKPCSKQLACGHLCEEKCHLGNCLPCLKTVTINCRCGRTTSNTVCHQGNVEQPQCMRLCRATLNCGRHACDERCCPGERKAVERQSAKRKQRPLNSAPRPVDDGFEAEHICTRQCGRLLKCGNHVCEELCHKGPCGSCREAVFEEISCHCGRTVLQPPLPCGTQPPPCRYNCDRPKSCGHPQVPHHCHQDDEDCPKCPFLIEKRCMCGKKTLKNQQCWLQDVRCGEVCGKKLRCGSHFCRKPCHRPGECEDAGGQPCQQPCGKPKKACGHPDENVCHAPYACKEDKPCPHKIFITCDCQAQKQEMKCNASKDNEGNGTKSLPCNDECARLERNRKLALALNIDQTTHVEGGDHVPYSAETLFLFSEHVKWGQTQEREFRVFASAEDEKRLRFKPMSAHQRAFVHSLAEDFGLDSESMDPEPHRHVAIWKTPRFVRAPGKTLAESLRIRQAQRATMAGSTSDTEGTKRGKASNEVGEPFNGFLVSNPRFGLTVDDLSAELAVVVPSSSPFTFDVEFLPSEEVVLKAMTRTVTEQDLQQSLLNLKPALTAAIATKAIGSIQLCHTDSSLNVTRRESDNSAGDGWSRVAAKGAAPRRLPQQTVSVGNNAFSALSGNKVTFAKKKVEKAKPRKELIVDDWEAAEAAEEAKEKVVSGSSGEEDAANQQDDAAAAELISEEEKGALSEDPQGIAQNVLEPSLPTDDPSRREEQVPSQPALGMDRASEVEKDSEA